MLKLKKIIIDNFMSIGHAEIDLDSGGLIGVFGNNLDKEGSNGSGKSAIFEAIIWCLFGQTIRKSLANSIIRKHTNEAKVKLIYLNPDPQEIERIKPLNKPATIAHNGSRMPQELITELIGLDYRSTVQALLFGPEHARFTRNTDAEQKAILDRILNLEVYKDALEITKTDYNLKYDQLVKNQAILEVIDRNIILLTKKIEDYKSELEEIKQNNIKILEEQREIEDKLKPYSDIINLKKDYIEIQRNLDKLRQEYKELSRDIEELNNNKCPTCGQIIDDNNLYGDYYKNLENIIAQLGYLELEEKKFKDIIESFNEPEYEQLQKRLIELTGKIKSNFNLSGALEEAKRSLIECNKENEKLKIKIDDINKELHILEFWVEGFGNSGIKSFILDSIVPFLTNRTNEYLAVIDPDIRIEINTQKTTISGELRDKLEISVTNVSGADDYNCNSSGEKQRIDIAIALALHDLVAEKTGKNFGMVIFDEIFEHLDPIGCERVLKLLKQSSSKDKTVFLISHNPAIQELLDKSIIIEKKDGISSCLNATI